MALATRPPRFITCQRAACEAVVSVANGYEQRRRKYCSHRCAALAYQPLTAAEGAKGGRERAHRARLAIRLKVETLPAIDAFRYGYKLGLESKRRQIKRRTKVAA